MDLPRVDQVSLRDRAYRILLDAIVTGGLQPGTRLRDHHLAQQMGLSRTPIREALQRLEDEGLVHTAPRSHTAVAPIEARTAREAFPVVAALHALAVRLSFPRWLPADSEALHAANTALAAALDQGSPRAAIEADDAFHGVFVARADNTELIRMLESLMPKVRRLEWLQFSSLRGRESVAQHMAIMDAIHVDVDATVRLVEENWLSLGALILQSLPSPQEGE